MLEMMTMTAPINVAAFSGKEEVVMTLLTEFNCDPNIKGRLRSIITASCLPRRQCQSSQVTSTQIQG